MIFGKSIESVSNATCVSRCLDTCELGALFTEQDKSDLLEEPFSRFSKHASTIVFL